MVHRHGLNRFVCVLAVVVAAAVWAPAAFGADARVAIGHYHWSKGVVHVDLGQHVTWYWVGPDTMHSVTGISADDAGQDSDPHTNEPEHRIGFKFQLTFTHPGVYEFQCKLHPVVHGEVVVSDVPGNPSDDPDPIPRPNADLMRPTLNGLFLDPVRFSVRGTTLHYSLDDSSSVDAEIWHLVRGRRGSYAGWQELHGHIGFNQASFASASRHFRARPGRYMVFLTPTDRSNNVGRTAVLRFSIRGRTNPR